MSREVRKVPADWQHPTDGFYPGGRIRYVPLLDGREFAADSADWDASKAAWEQKEKHKGHEVSFEECYGSRPAPEHYMPQWSDAQRTHFMMYKTTTEGTPCSPAFATIEELAAWLADNEVSIFADETADYDGWLEICKGSQFVIMATPR